MRLNPDQAPGNACTLGSEGEHGPDRISRYEYDNADNVLRETRAVGTGLEQVHVEYTYNAENQVDTVTDANGNTAKFDYDNYGRKIKWCFPSKARGSGTINCNDYESYQYDENGNRKQLRKRDGKVIHYQYDKLNRLTYKNLPGTSSGDVYYRYELTGAQLHARFGSHSGQGVITNYSGFGEPEQDQTTVGGVTRTINRAFDKNSNRTRITHPDNQFFDYLYDDLNRLDSLEDTAGNTLIADSYDQFARPESRVTAGNAITALTYDNVSRLNSLGFQFSGTANDLLIEFGYNPAGQLTGQNLINHLYHHTGSVGNTGGYVVNGLNQYASVNGVAFDYDDNGNLTDDGPNTYTYDVENRLISVSGNVNATLAYDPMGRLYRYTANGTTTDFIYDGDSLILEYQGGNITRRYVHGTSVDTPLVQYTGSSVGTTNRQFLHRNHQGSVIAASNNSGAIAYINTYDAYGVPATGNQGRFGYTGQMYLPELKLYHYRARVYNPHIGRFMQTDPIGYEDQMNLYAYVHNDPLNATDPSGMLSFVVARPLDDPRAARLGYGHGYVVSNARFLGDRSATVHSYGMLSNGNMGNVGNRAKAATVSKETNASDVKHWNSLSANQTSNISEINAPDNVVSAVAGAVSESSPYALTPSSSSQTVVHGGLIVPTPDVNSNSAAFAIGDVAEQISSGDPNAGVDRGSFDLTLPGASASGKVQFNCTKDLQGVGGC